MKKRTFLISFILLLSCASFAQKDKAAIEMTIVHFFDGLSELNNAKLKEVTTADFLLLEVGKVWNLDTLINKIAPLRQMKYERINQFRFIRTEQNDNTAWVSYYNTADFQLNDTQQTKLWLESAVLINEKGQWKIKMLHSTRINNNQ